MFYPRQLCNGVLEELTQMKYLTAILLAVLAATAVHLRHENWNLQEQLQLQRQEAAAKLKITKEELQTVRNMEEHSSEAWYKCATESQQKREYVRDAAFARMVREETTRVIWPCGVPPKKQGCHDLPHLQCVPMPKSLADRSTPVLATPSP